MQLYYPRSFFKLLVVGFALTAVPLVAALVNNAVAIDRLANRSQQAVYRAVQATQASRRLSELVTAMERSARQFVILGDRALLESYDLQRAQLLSTARQFDGLPFDSEQIRALGDILRSEEEIYRTLSEHAPVSARLRDAAGRFVRIADYARAIHERSNALIDREVESMQATASRAQRITLWQLLALIPVVLFMAIGFTVLIARPIREIDTAIRRLGDGEFAAPVRVGGPDDLQHLGERLEWMRQRLVELENQKNRFLSQVSHELKTPLTALREGAELLGDGVVGSLTPEQREIAEILRVNSIKLQKLIEDLLSYSASQSSKASLDLRPISLRQIIGRVADDQRLAARAKDLKLRIDVVDITLAADAGKLRIILDNLISNAIKFSPPGGSIAVLARNTADSVEIDVRDDGPGIDPVDRERVFEPFYQGKQGADGLVKGTGIGLSVVREYVSEHGGSVEVVQDGHAQGALFRVRLPLKGRA